ncbi:MAG TPA: NYN domain-containing protein [Gemmatimonadaceae bacterium]|nr:NYN domain-containing protein [Gemmatimonadaceae bacterium]
MHRGPQAHAAPSGLGGPLVHAPNAALLIDFDNVTMGIRSDLQTELRNLLSSDIIHGKVAVQRAYADWRRYPQYIVPLSEASIDLIFAPAYGSSKKNATDIRLAIDAMELVFTRPEIGTIILLSGDSDFSSLVIKLKEYGKYVIGVGIRESSSDLLVQNCDEYYSYNALAGLVKSGDEPGTTKYDPWELVTEAINRMVRNGDVMRSDRLKQVMQEIDGTFDEKNLGISKFSKFCLEAAQKGLLVVNKLENGQLEVAPPSAGEKSAAPVSAAPARTAPAPRVAAPAVEGEEAREPRGRRGRRGGRGRNRGGERAGAVSADGTESPRVVTAEHAVVAGAIDQSRIVTPVQPIMTVPASPVAPVTLVADVAPRERAPHREPHRAPAAPAAPVSRGDSSIGVSGIRLTRDEAFSLVRDAVAALATGDDAVPSERVRAKAFALLGRDSESLSERNFARILRDAHDGDVIDLRKRGDAFEVASVAPTASVADQLEVKDAALKAADAKEKAANMVIVPRGMGHRGAPARGGRGGFGGKPSGLPPNLLLLGAVDDTPATPAVETKTPRRSGRVKKDETAPEAAAAEKPARTRTPRAKKAPTTA